MPVTATPLVLGKAADSKAESESLRQAAGVESGQRWFDGVTWVRD